MTDKKSFGLFLKLKRSEKNYSQKDLAELLFVTEGAVSKWERGVSYPDITLISDICRILDISEHEFITASTDTDTQKIKYEAKKFRIISGAWFWIPSILYSIALLTCFICNLAINHTLSWFYIVLTSLLCAYSFIPTFTSFFDSKKLLIFTITSFSSICLLLFTCAAYTKTLFWFPIACIGVLMGYILLFLPILLSKTKIKRFRFIISFSLIFLLTILLLLSIYVWKPFMLKSAFLITCYSFAPVILCVCICSLRFDVFIKTGVCVLLNAIPLYFTEYIVDILFGTNDRTYQVNFYNWQEFLEGNIQFLSLIFILLIGLIFLLIGLFRIKKHK